MRLLKSLLVLLTFCAAGPAPAGPEGQMTWAVHISLAPTWFDPAETPGIITPFMVLYALHDALVKPMPGNAMAPSLAESWSVSPDGLVYEFVAAQGRQVPQRRPGDRRGREVLLRALPRRGRQDPEGAGWPPWRSSDPLRVRFRLKQPWPDFMTFYGTPATGAGWIVPEEVRREGRRRRLQEGAGRRRAVQVRLVHARRRAGARGLRAATGARRRA